MWLLPLFYIVQLQLTLFHMSHSSYLFQLNGDGLQLQFKWLNCDFFILLIHSFDLFSSALLCLIFSPAEGDTVRLIVSEAVLTLRGENDIRGDERLQCSHIVSSEWCGIERYPSCTALTAMRRKQFMVISVDSSVSFQRESHLLSERLETTWSSSAGHEDFTVNLHYTNII